MDFNLAKEFEANFFRQLWDNSADPFWLCEVAGEDFIFIALNPAETRLDERFKPGVTLRQIIGFTPESEHLIAGYFTCRDTGKTLTFEQHPVLHGKPCLFQTLLVPVLNAEGKVTHIWGTARNLTDYLTTHLALEELNHQLEQMVEKRTRELQAANLELHQANKILENLATHDSLTNLANRRHFFAVAAAEIARSRRYDHPLSLIMLDIDHFKQFNDTYGHACGDKTLQTLASLLTGNLRQNDLAARLGGEEFVVLLPETSLNEALHYAERLRNQLEATGKQALTCGIALTASFGVAQLQPSDSVVDSFLLRADQGLYLAKSRGRNRVECAEGSEGQ